MVEVLEAKIKLNLKLEDSDIYFLVSSCKYPLNLTYSNPKLRNLNYESSNILRPTLQNKS